MKEIIEIIKNENLGEVRIDESMETHTSIRAGGIVKVMYLPNSIESLVKVIDEVRKESIPFFIIGRGSNLLVPDDVNDVLIIKIANNLNEVEISETGHVIVQAGYSLQKLSKQVSKLGLSGLEFAGGIPAALGGAIYMNAGAHVGDMKSIVTKVRTITKDGKIKTYSNSECHFEYRESIFKKNKEIIIDCELLLNPGDRAAIFKRMMGNLEYRKEMQPLDLPSFGSTFQNPNGFHSAKLIEESNLKGQKIGGAQISTKHSNFIVNVDDATVDDVLKLITHVQEVVKSNTAINLEKEVIILTPEMYNVW